MKVEFDENIAEDFVICWGLTVRLPKYALFGSTREERRKTLEKKIREILKEIPLNFERAKIRLASAWVRYYVFELDLDGRKFALNILSPNSSIKSFKKIEFPEKNVAKPIYLSDEFMLQEWIDGIPLSEFREGFIMKEDPKIGKCIKLTAKLLYELFKIGYIYNPWEDYEAVLRGDEIILLDLTRFERSKLGRRDFVKQYYGAPFFSPDLIVENERNRIFWRGTSDRDYFGVSREEYEELFLEGISLACNSFEEFLDVSQIDEERASSIWRKRY